MFLLVLAHPGSPKQEPLNGCVCVCAFVFSILMLYITALLAQLMSLPLTVSCFSKIQIGFTFLVPAHPGSPEQRAIKQLCVCVCAVLMLYIPALLASLVSCQVVSGTCLCRSWRVTALNESQSIARSASVDDRILTPCFRS